jgi:hypothetical protein
MIGPFATIDLGSGRSLPLYLLRYGAGGEVLSPQTTQILEETLGAASDVFLFSHGWNNTFDDASRNYRQFIDGYLSQAQLATSPGPHTVDQAVLIGVVWPSISFLMPWENGPVIAADTPVAAARTEEMRTFVTGELDLDAQARLNELLDGAARLSPEQAREAGALVLAALRSKPDPDDGSPPPSVDDLLEAWAALDQGGALKPRDPDDFGDIAPVSPALAPGEPAPAGLLGVFDPRNLLRAATVWKMKDRAGAVGAHGVGPLLRHVLAQTDARLHLIGHSFGTRVLMSALAAEPVSRPARSALLLQGAVNRWCFADKVPGLNTPGGYRPALDRVELPILSTWSTHDVALRQAFHLAVRGASLGEPDIAALGDTDLYGALGGYGPAGIDGLLGHAAAIRAGSTTYDLRGPTKVVMVDGSGDIDGKPAINGHGDVNNPTTWWALRCLVAAP